MDSGHCAQWIRVTVDGPTFFYIFGGVRTYRIASALGEE